MNLWERVDSASNAITAAIQGELRAMWKAIPVIIQSGDGHTSVGQAAVTGVVRMPDGTITNPPLPQFQDAPVHFPGGGGVTHTHPIANGDEGIMLFLDRAQDSWFQSGGVNNTPVDDRAHHMADCRFIPGGRSNPRKMSPLPSSSSAQSRSDDGNHVQDTHPQNGVTHASAAGVKHISGSSTTTVSPGGITHEAGQVSVNCC